MCFEGEPLSSRVFQLSIRFNIPSATGVNPGSSGNIAHHGQHGVELFHSFRRIFENTQTRYPGFSDEFIRVLREHLSKAHPTKSTRNKSTTDESNNSLVSGVVKLRI